MRRLPLLSLLPLLLLAAAALLCSPASAQSGNDTREPLESLWSLGDAEFNSSLAAAVLNVSSELLRLQNFSNFVVGYDSVNLTEPLRLLWLVVWQTETVVFQLNTSAPAVKVNTLLTSLQQILNSLRFDWAAAVGEKSLPACYEQFLARTLAIEAEAEKSLQRLWQAAAAGATDQQLQEFLHMTGTYHSDLAGRLSRFLATTNAAASAKAACSDGSLRRLFDLFVGSCRLLARAEAVQLAAQQLGASPATLLTDLQSQWRQRLQQVAASFEQQLVALWRSDFRAAVVGDVNDLVAIGGTTSALADAVQSKLTQKYFYVRYAWLQLQQLPLGASGLLIWPTGSEFVCLSKATGSATLVLLCRNGRQSQQEEAAANAEWQRLRDGATAANRNSIPATPLLAAQSVRVTKTDTATAILDELVTPNLMKVRLQAAGNTSFLAVKMATTGATQPVLLRATDATFAVTHKVGNAWFLAAPVHLTSEYVPTPTSATPKAASQLAAASVVQLLLPSLLVLLLSLSLPLPQ